MVPLSRTHARLKRRVTVISPPASEDFPVWALLNQPFASFPVLCFSLQRMDSVSPTSARHLLAFPTLSSPEACLLKQLSAGSRTFWGGKTGVQCCSASHPPRCAQILFNASSAGPAIYLTSLLSVL